MLWLLDSLPASKAFHLIQSVSLWFLFLCAKLTALDGQSLEEDHVKRDAGPVTVVERVYGKVVESEQLVVIVDELGAPISTVTHFSVKSVILSTVSAVTVLPTHGPSFVSALSTDTRDTVKAVPATLVSALAPAATPTPAPTPTVDTAKVGPATQVPVPPPETTSIPHIGPGIIDPATTSTRSIILPSDTAAAVGTPLFPTPEDSDNAGGYGFAYSPYLANGNCKSAQQVATDFAGIANIGQYSVVRIYGTDCNQVATVLPAAKAHGLKLFAGIFDLNTLNSEVATIVAAAKGNWGSFDTISVGNELVQSGTSPAAVVAAVGSARNQLRAAGYHGPVVIVDTVVASRAHPELCNASDYCAVNCHPFFDGGVAASGAGNFLSTQISSLRNVLSNKNQRIVITETGWPWKGSSNRAAVPSTANQAAALSSIKNAFASNHQNVILFSGFNDPWKKSVAATFFADPFWGFLGNAPSG